MRESLSELLKRAELLERERRFQEAAETWKQLASAGEQQLAAAGCPPLMEVQKRQAGAHFQAADFGSTIVILEELRRQEETVEILSLLARVYLNAERFEDAIETGRRTLAIDPDAVLVKHVLGRAHMRLGEQAGVGGGALQWQEAIEQFTDILVINPRDEVAKDYKLLCVRRRDDSFGDTMQSEFRRFAQLIESGDRAKAFEVHSELVRIVIEHAIDIQHQMPAQTIRIAREFIAMIEDYSRRSSIDLVSSMGHVFAQLHSLAMWAHLMNDEPGAAELALEQALKSASQDTLPWVSKAELMFALQRPDEVRHALDRAEAFVRYEHDRFLMGTSYHMLGQYDPALAWIDKIDVAKFKSESYRPDRAERILLRMKTEIQEEKKIGIERTPEDLKSGGDVADLIKRILNGSAPTTE